MTTRCTTWGQGTAPSSLTIETSRPFLQWRTTRINHMETLGLKCRSRVNPNLQLWPKYSQGRKGSQKTMFRSSRSTRRNFRIIRCTITSTKKTKAFSTSQPPFSAKARSSRSSNRTSTWISPSRRMSREVARPSTRLTKYRWHRWKCYIGRIPAISSCTFQTRRSNTYPRRSTSSSWCSTISVDLERKSELIRSTRCLRSSGKTKSCRTWSNSRSSEA